MLPLLALSGVNWKRVAGLGALGGLIALLAFVRLQDIELGKRRAEVAELQAAYANPKRKSKTKTVKREGPVSVKTRTVRTPDGREEITREELRGPVTTTTADSVVLEPVFRDARTSRWLASVSFQPLHRSDPKGWTAWGGYSLRNRLDMQAGMGGAGRLSLMLTFRF